MYFYRESCKKFFHFFHYRPKKQIENQWLSE